MDDHRDGNHPLAPRYAESFRCIGSACEDTCCHGWKVPVDQDTYQRYQNLPDSPLSALIREAVERLPESNDGPESGGNDKKLFAIIRMNGENFCPLLTADRLCGIQAEYGEDYLSHTCATYPRVVHSINGLTETALTLSCPEAARLVLLNPHLLADLFSAEYDAASALPQQKVAPGAATEPWKLGVRNAVLRIVTNRTHPLWQRIFLLGGFSRQVEAFLPAAHPDTPEGNEPSPDLAAFLEDFTATVASGALCGPLSVLPADNRVQLDAVLHLAGLMLHKSNLGPRFVDCIHAFTAGIGNGPGATLESLLAHYTAAYTQYFAPFCGEHPYILENLLVNNILRLRFPFGPEKESSSAESSPSRQFATLAAQFALTRGLLIGVAGFHRERFSTEHVVHTVQAASKHFEHHPEFLKQIDAWLTEHHLDGPRELTILLNEPAMDRAGSTLESALPPQDSKLRAAP